MDVIVAPAAGGYAALLDGKTPRTPNGRPLVLPTEALAELVGSEWAAQGEAIVRDSMPATRLAGATVDAFPAVRDEMASRVADFAESDLLCYFAEAPQTLVARQEETWAPLLEWARVDLGLDFERTAGVSHVDQPTHTLAAVRDLAAGLSDFELAGLIAAAQLFGSALLALALMRGRLNGAEAFAACRLDETFQSEAWGVDAEAARSAKAMAVEAAMLGDWFAALR